MSGQNVALKRDRAPRFFQLFIVLLGIGPRERSSVGNALGQRSCRDECNVGRKYVRAVRSKNRSVSAVEKFQLIISQNVRSRFSATPPSSSLSA